MFEDIAYPDSISREFYALVDGSFITVENGTTMLHGEAYLIKDGVLQKISRKNETILI